MYKGAILNPTKLWLRKTSIVGIYKIVSPTGRVYIGQSWEIGNRWRQHKGMRSKGCQLLNRSFCKYGAEAHEFSVIHKLPHDVSQNVLNEYEIFYIKIYRDANIKLMNLSDGGLNCVPSEETRRKISQSNKGKHFIKKTPEQKEKQRLSMLGKRWKIGKKMPPFSEARKKLASERMKGKRYSLGSKRPTHAILATAEKNRGKKRTEEQRKRMSKADMGRPYHGKNNGKVRTDAMNKVQSEIQKARTDNKGELHNMAKLTNEQVIGMRGKYIPIEYPLSRLAKEYNISKRNVLDIIHRKIWSHI